MARRKSRRQRARYRPVAIGGLLFLLATAFYTTTRYPPARLHAHVVATELRFEYHPIPPGQTTGPEVPLLAGEPFADFSVRSFERLVAPTGSLSVRPDSDAPWEAVQQSGPVVITGQKGLPAKADFKDVTIKGWQFKGNPTIALRIPDEQAEPSVRAVIDGQDIELAFGDGQSLEFECQLCRIEGRNEDAPLVRQMRLSNLDYTALTATSTTTMLLDIAAGSRGFGRQRFRMSRPWLCGGPGVSPESSVLKGTVEFPDAGISHTLTGAVNASSSVLRLTDEDEFMVTALRAVREESGSALDVTFEGLAQRAEMSGTCNTAGTSVQPSLYAALAHSRIVVVISTALGVFLAWLALFDTLHGVWSRVKNADGKK